jgi:MoaA/NifB/PqqE/SkfB family radical SAM enzyme
MTDAPTQSITWRHNDRYSPVNDRSGITDPAPEAFPPARERVSQDPDPFSPEFVDQREVMRVTYQGDDRCQLACPGCYTAGRLTAPVPEVLARGGRKVAPFEEFSDHIDAMGPGLQDVYLIGAEPTVAPAAAAAKHAHAHARGWPQMACTNGAVSVERFEATFGAALDSGSLYVLTISLDSIDPATNNRLRGRSYAHERTCGIIRHCVARGARFRVQMTVWAQNYATVIDSVHWLYEAGVRGFSFHSGTLEGVPDPDALDLAPLDPLAWRALVEQLYRFRDGHDDLETFSIPFLAFTEQELREHVIGDAALTDAYLEHVTRMERGESSVLPVKACPALDVPQVYLYANDGPAGRGTLSACQIHNPPGGDAFAEYDPQAKRFRTIADPARNQLALLAASPHLCPATGTAALRRSSDRVATEAGDLFHGCRYIASNQMPYRRGQFGDDVYRDAIDYCRAVTAAIENFPRELEAPMARVRRLVEGVRQLAARTTILRDAIETGHSLTDA